MDEEEIEGRILELLYDIYKSQGPAVVLRLKVMEEEMALGAGEIRKGLLRLAREGLVRYWELGEAASISEYGLKLCEKRFPRWPRGSSR